MTRQATTVKRVLCGPDGECSGMCEQGKDCVGSVLASQAALGMHRFFTEEGGRQIDTEATPTSSNQVWIAIGAVTAIALLCAAAIAMGWPVSIPF